MELKNDLLYTSEHEWVRIEGSKATVGLTGHALEALGEVTYLEVVGPGENLARGGRLGTVESVKTASDIYAPVAGRVVEVNARAVDDPALLDASAYWEGWLAVFEAGPDGFGDEGLMSPEEYGRLIEGQV